MVRYLPRSRHGRWWDVKRVRRTLRRARVIYPSVTVRPSDRSRFAMIARHFLPEEELCAWIAKTPGVSDTDARVLCKQVEGHDYNPPRRERILEWQQEQSFPICPDPNGCNVYRDLKYPEHVYAHIQEFYENQVK